MKSALKSSTCREKPRDVPMRRVTLLDSTNKPILSPKQSSQDTATAHFEADKDKLVKKLMEKITSQAQELTALNTALESSAEYVHKCESQITSLEERLPSQLTIKDVTGKLIHQMPNHFEKHDAAKQRKSEIQHREQIEALTRQLMETEKRLQDSNNAYRIIKADLERMTKEFRSLDRKYKQLNQSTQPVSALLDNSQILNSSGRSSLSESNSLINSKIELRDAKDKLVKYEKKLKALTAADEEQRGRITVLESALEYRVQEGGMSGQGELLAQLASVRGEVVSLKVELQQQRNRVSSTEHHNQELSKDRESLVQEIESLQDRLQSSQRDNALLNASDYTLHLRQLEHERDILLDYVNVDMDSNAGVIKENENLKKEVLVLQQVEQDLQNKLATLESKVFICTTDMLNKEAVLSNWEIKYNQVVKQSELLQKDLEVSAKTIARKNSEQDELTKMQMELLQKMKEKELSYQRTVNELRIAKNSLQSQDSVLATEMVGSEVCDGPRNGLHLATRSTADEIFALKGNIDSLKAQLSAKERDFEQLALKVGEFDAAATISIVEERNSLVEECNKLKIDLAHLKTMGQALAELSETLLSKFRSNEIRSSGNQSVRKSPLPVISSARPLLYEVSPTRQTSKELVRTTQDHSVWTSLPQIRQLCLPLYECIQKLFQDLHARELEASEFLSTIASLKRSLDIVEIEKSDLLEKVISEQDNRILQQKMLRADVDRLEAELVRGRASHVYLDQVKYILQSVPTSKDGETFQSNFDDSFDLPSLSSSHFKGINNNNLDNIISDEQIPDLLGKALMRNFNSVNALSEARIANKELKIERDQLLQELSGLKDEYNHLQRSIEGLSNEFQNDSDKKERHEEKLRTDLETALDLIEKQNSLSLSFESKLEALKRDRQVRAAQVSTLQQREEQNRKILIGVLKNFWEEFASVTFPRSVYIDMGLGVSGKRHFPAPGDNEKFSDVVRTLSDILSKLFLTLCRSQSVESVEAGSVYGTRGEREKDSGFVPREAWTTSRLSDGHSMEAPLVVNFPIRQTATVAVKNDLVSKDAAETDIAMNESLSFRLQQTKVVLNDLRE